MALRSHPFRNIFALQLERSAAAAPDVVNTDLHRILLSDATHASSQGDLSTFSTSANSTDDDSTSSPNYIHHAVDTSASKSTSSDGRPNILLDFSTASISKNISDAVTNPVAQTLVVENLENKSTRASEEINKSRHDKVSDSEAANETLAAKSSDVGEESVRPETADRLKRKQTFSTFSVSLTREQIEADLLAMGGGPKRSRRAKKKRPRNVQTQLDDLFPGLRLKHITPNDYRVRDHN